MGNKSHESTRTSLPVDCIRKTRQHRHICGWNGSATATIAPVSPGQNPFVESFNGPFGDEFLNINIVLVVSVQEANLLAEQRRIESTVYRPHSAQVQAEGCKAVMPKIIQSQPFKCKPNSGLARHLAIAICRRCHSGLVRITAK